MTDTKVGNVTLSTNTCDQYGRLHYVTYGNGFVTEYIYDDLDRVSEIKQGTANALVTKYCFIYNNEGDLYELRNYDTHRATFFEYDHAGRCMASTEKSFTGSYGNPVAYTGTVSGYRYEYDENSNLTKLTCTVAGSTWETVYTYDDDNRPLSAAFNNSSAVVYIYDSIGRLATRRLWTGSQFTDISETYVSGANGSKTDLVSTYKNGSDDAYNYSYDANGNITEITKGSMSFTYDYDKANQLVRENLYYGNGNSNNATYSYEYDLWGNLLTKKRYIYTTLNNLVPGSELETVYYTYGDSQWKDKLTSFNGSTITYDAMGNPTSYLGNTLVWEGKKLKQLTIPIQAGITHRPTVCSYEYDENGLRLEKTVNGTTTEYYYNESVLIGMKIGTGSSAKILRFSYDASGNVMTVAYSTDNGSNFTTYFYLRNAQNDIVKLIDNTGAAVVEYIYDSWGKLLSVTGSLTTTLGTDQPFRYRGYVYDTETQLYYLQSRYYDPTTCRFISADVLLSTGQGVIGHNSFAYCLGNPVKYVDTLGQRPDEWMNNSNWDSGNIDDTKPNHDLIVFLFGYSSELPDGAMYFLEITITIGFYVRGISIIFDEEKYCVYTFTGLSASKSYAPIGYVQSEGYVYNINNIEDYQGAFVSASASLGPCCTGGAIAENGVYTVILGGAEMVGAGSVGLSFLIYWSKQKDWIYGRFPWEEANHPYNKMFRTEWERAAYA